MHFIKLEYKNKDVRTNTKDTVIVKTHNLSTRMFVDGDERKPLPMIVVITIKKENSRHAIKVMIKTCVFRENSLGL